MTESLMFPQRHALDTEDAALHFVEEELGRFDAKNNWETIKAKGEADKRIQEFLSRLNLTNSPREIAEFLDRFFMERPGRWR